MIKDQNNTEASAALYLSALALHGKSLQVDELNYIDLKSTYHYARSASICAITFMAIEDIYTKLLEMEHLDAELPDEFDDTNEAFYLHNWKIIRINSFRRNLLFDQELRKIQNFCEKEQIWYMPLKGTMIKNLYPSSDLREMNDIDILIDGMGRKPVYKFMTNSGYKYKSANDIPKKKIKNLFDSLNHKGVDKTDDKYIDELLKYVGQSSDDYTKKPFLYFEIHEFLIKQYENPIQFDYYLDVKDRLIKDYDNQYGYHFSNEDFYIYMLVHAYKHFSRMGTGVRFLIDMYVYLNHFKDEMDWDYINNTCEKLQLAEFEKDARELALKVFDLEHEYLIDELSDAQRKVYESCITAGTFGNKNSFLKSHMYDINAKGSKSRQKYRYLKSRLFPEDKWYRMHHPFFYRYKILKPFFIVYRTTVLLFKGRTNIKEELKNLNK